jgi:hypothetical protein
MILWLEVDCTVQGQLCLLANAQVSPNIRSPDLVTLPYCLARSTGKATKGWATINALQFLE